ncbi:MAG TPA: glycosyltransferase family 39 protein [Thermoanaerobaculia bacterium]
MMVSRIQSTFSTAAAGGRWALAAALLLFLALALFGHRYHWVEEAGTAERDGYVAQAEQILRGELPRDPFRPLLYPILTAGLALLVGDPFLAARLISNLAAAALAWQCWACGRRLGGPGGTPAGAWAMALAAANPNLWILGQHVSTDMLFAALAAAALLAGLRYLEEPGARAALAGGAALGLAAFTRSNALFLLPPLLAAWWLAPGERKRRLGHLAGAAAVAVLMLIPHWALRQAVFGDPFHDENWKNLAWKLHGYPDWSYLDRVPYSGALEIVKEDPMAVVRGGLSELARFLTGGAAQLFGTWAHVLLIAAGAAVALRKRSRPAAWLLFAGGAFLLAIAFAFFTWGRLLLLLLPLGYGLAFAPWKERTRDLLALGLVLLLAVKTFGFRLPAFVARHPYEEVAVLRRLDASLPPGPVLAGSSPFLGRYLRREYVDLPDAFGPEIRDPRLYFARIEPLVRRSGVAYLVVGETDLRDRPPSLLDGTARVPWLRLASKENGVTVWKVRPPQGTSPD